MAIVSYLTYQLTTGQITWVGTCQDSQLLTMGGPGLGVLSGEGKVEPSLYYIAGGVLTERPQFSINSTVQGNKLTLTNVPYGAAVKILGNALQTIVQDSADLIMEITMPQAGRYVVRVILFPYREWIEEFNINA